MIWCFIYVVFFFVLYKIFDRLIRIPRIGRYGERYILITGCDTGFGNILAKRLDQMGCHVFAGCYSETGETELRKVSSERLHAFSMDVSKRDSVQNALKFVKSKLPPEKGLWGIVNNAGLISYAGPPEWIRMEEWRDQCEVNVWGLIDVTLSFLPLIKKEKGRIVNTASIAGRLCFPPLIPYCISKGAVEMFSDGIRRTLAPYGCRVLIIEPGVHRTFLCSEENLTNAYRKVYDKIDPEIKAEYGEAFYNYVSIGGVNKFLSLGSFRLTDVVDAYEHALLALFPRARNMVGWDANVIYMPIQHLPEWLGDWLLAKLDPEVPLPAALVK